jgi:hypothetical protein
MKCHPNFSYLYDGERPHPAYLQECCDRILCSHQSVLLFALAARWKPPTVHRLTLSVCSAFPQISRQNRQELLSLGRSGLPLAMVAARACVWHLGPVTRHVSQISAKVAAGARA